MIDSSGVRRFFIIAGASALSCLAPAAAQAQAQAGPFDDCAGAPRVVATGERYNNREKNEGKLTGSVEIECGNLQLFADEVAWDATTVRAHGKLLFVDRSQGLTVYAERMEMDRATRFGTFFNAQGFARLGDTKAPPTPFGSQELDIQFKGEMFARIGPETYRLTHGEFSTCDQPTPRWYMTGSEGTVVLDKRVILKNAVLRVKDVPLLYLPFIYYPINKEGRSTGFLMPSYSASQQLGSGISNAFFIAMGRSQDTTLYHTFSSKGGNTFAGDYRYVASPSSDGRVMFKVIGTDETLGEDGVTVITPSSQSYNIDGGVSQGLPRGFRLNGNANYFTSITDQQKYRAEHRRPVEQVALVLGQSERDDRSLVSHFGAGQPARLLQRNANRNPAGTGAADRLLLHRPPARAIAHLRGRQCATGLPDPATRHQRGELRSEPGAVRRRAARARPSQLAAISFGHGVGSVSRDALAREHRPGGGRPGRGADYAHLDRFPHRRARACPGEDLDAQTDRLRRAIQASDRAAHHVPVALPVRP